MISTNVPFSTVNRLLVSSQHKLPELPRDPQTLMRTPRSCPTREVSPGEYIHLGIANGLRRVVPMYLPPQSHIIHLHMNVDGMKLHNNGTTVIWPILARIVRPFTSPVFLVGLYGGVRKPEDVCTYLHDVVQELEDLLRLGVVVNDLHHQVVLDAIICDKPARSFVTRMRAHNSYYGCDKCCIKGQYFQTKITFPYGQHVLRTDNSIRRDTRNSLSPFFTLPIDFVHCFPIDYMHSICLGVVRRLASIFVNGDRPVRIGPAGLNRVDRMIRNIRAHMPVEFPHEFKKAREHERKFQYTSDLETSDVTVEATPRALFCSTPERIPQHPAPVPSTSNQPVYAMPQTVHRLPQYALNTAPEIPMFPVLSPPSAPLFQTPGMAVLLQQNKQLHRKMDTMAEDLRYLKIRIVNSLLQVHSSSGTTGFTFPLRSKRERQPLTYKNKPDPGNLGNSLDPVYQSVNRESVKLKTIAGHKWLWVIG
ncbi:hypothetical protein T265_06219 [Opisthorchis viverrini]|uniref:Transposase domain-containing protein n=1 Tax=Opisthorchis viverrini TaxID=6198 RepID=A0A074ZH20_OPIVI|nr:hypothetical protein T265_06219 [Opisthorchis viverrini]KER26576.1 hypothetical protein T265_06219 [Opisthorchis viverrini]